MSEIYLHNRPVESLFQLLGEDENDITYSIGWALYSSPAFLKQFLKETVGIKDQPGDVTIRLQHHRHKTGITDIEIEAPGKFHLIAEAKKGWNLPRKEQLEKYASRIQINRSPVRRILALSECSQEYAEHHIEGRRVKGVPVTPVSWNRIGKIASKAIEKGRNVEKRLLRDLLAYLRKVTTMQDFDSNWVYVVALGSGTKKGWGIPWIDIVEKKRRYFHRMGERGWPKEPPNYIGFRYHGRLQSIHHVEEYKVTTELHEYIREIPPKKRGPDFIYRLGPPIVPHSKVKTGRIYPNGRVWCMLDTLLTCKTISEARDLSKKREQRAG